MTNERFNVHNMILHLPPKIEGSLDVVWSYHLVTWLLVCSRLRSYLVVVPVRLTSEVVDPNNCFSQLPTELLRDSSIDNLS